MMEFSQTIKRTSFVNNYKTAIYLAILLALPVSSYALDKKQIPSSDQPPLIAGMGMAAVLPEGVTSKTFDNPPSEYRLVQYSLTKGALNSYPDWGIGGYMGFFYKNLYKQGAKGIKQIGPLVDAANKSGQTVWLADDCG